MTKSELVLHLTAKNSHLSRRDIERIVSTIFKEIANALMRGDRVELRGFGAFALRSRGRRIGRNPRTGEIVHVPGKSVPFFKVGKDLRVQLNAGDSLG